MSESGSLSCFFAVLGLCFDFLGLMLCLDDLVGFSYPPENGLCIEVFLLFKFLVPSIKTLPSLSLRESSEEFLSFLSLLFLESRFLLLDFLFDLKVVLVAGLRFLFSLVFSISGVSIQNL